MAFTAGSRPYAETVLNAIDPHNEFIENIASRQNCCSWEGHHIKDLRSISAKTIKLEHLVLLDNRVISFAFHIDQGIPILPFTGNSSDQELKHVLPLLEHLARPDVSIRKTLASRYQYGILHSWASKKAK